MKRHGLILCFVLVVCALAIRFSEVSLAQKEALVSQSVRTAFTSLDWKAEFQGSQPSVIEIEEVLFETSVDTWSISANFDEVVLLSVEYFVASRNREEAWEAINRHNNDSGEVRNDTELGDVSILGRSSLRLMHGPTLVTIHISIRETTRPEYTWRDDQVVYQTIGRAIVKVLDGEPGLR